MVSFSDLQESYDRQEPEETDYDYWIEVNANFNYDLLLRRCGSDKRLLELLKKAYEDAGSIEEEGIHHYLLRDFEVDSGIEQVNIDGGCFVHPDYEDELNTCIDSYHDEGTWEDIISVSGRFIEQFKINRSSVPVSTIGGFRLKIRKTCQQLVWVEIGGWYYGSFNISKNFVEVPMWKGAYEKFENFNAMAGFIMANSKKTFGGFLYSSVSRP